MNWIEIDKLLFVYYDKYYAKSKDQFLEAAMKKFGWDIKQAKTNTDWIVQVKSKVV